MALALVLRSLGYAVLEADTQDEALFICCDYPGTIHAVVTSSVADHRRNSPIQQLRSLRPQIRGLVICEATEYPVLTDSDGCIYLKKPFQLEELADSMKLLLDCHACQDVAIRSETSGEPETWKTPRTSRDSIFGFAVCQFSPTMGATLRWSCLTLVVAMLVSVLLLSRRGSSIPAPPRFGESRKFALQSPSDKSDQPLSPEGNEEGNKKESTMVAQVTRMPPSHRAQIKVRAPRRHYRRAVLTEPIGKAAAGIPPRFIPVDASAKETRKGHPPVHSSAGQQPYPIDEHNDGDYEQFSCGFGLRDGQVESLCPKDPNFPKLEDFELQMHQAKSGEWICLPKPKTRYAGLIGLGSSPGRTQEEAQRRVKAHYQYRSGQKGNFSDMW
jgi:hypothetical protein